MGKMQPIRIVIELINKKMILKEKKMMNFIFWIFINRFWSSKEAFWAVIYVSQRPLPYSPPPGLNKATGYETLHALIIYQ